MTNMTKPTHQNIIKASQEMKMKCNNVNVHQKNPKQCMNTSNPEIAQKDKEYAEFLRRMPRWFNFENQSILASILKE